MKPIEIFPTEQDLVTALKNHDKLALEVIYDKYASALNGIIERIIKANCDQLLIDVFLKIWNTADEYDSSKGRLFTWMMRIARNYALEVLRSKKMGFKNLEKGKLSEYELEVNNDNIQRHISNALSSHLRVVFHMIYFEGHTYSETAEKLAIPLSSIKVMMREAILKLRKVYKNL